jgi:hypothetical protein
VSGSREPTSHLAGPPFPLAYNRIVVACVMTTLDSYSWVDAECHALTVTFVRYAGEPREVLRAGGHTWVEGGRGSMSDALDVVDGYDFDREPVLIDRSGAWVALLAPNGYEYSYPGVLAGASRLGSALSAFWNVEAVMRILIAEAGTVTRSFDPLLIEDALGAPLPEESGLPFGLPESPLRGASLLLAERVTGQQITRDWLRRERDLVILNRRVWRGDDPGSTEPVPYHPRHAQ